MDNQALGLQARYGSHKPRLDLVPVRCTNDIKKLERLGALGLAVSGEQLRCQDEYSYSHNAVEIAYTD